MKDIAQILLPEIREHSTHTFHLFVIECEKRDGLMEHLKEREIPSLIHYPVSIHRQPMFGGKYDSLSLPILDQKVKSILSLPIHPFMTDEEIEFIISEIHAFYAK